MPTTSHLERFAKDALSGDRRRAASCAWKALWTSRLLVWAAAATGVLLLGTRAYSETHAGAADPSDSVRGLLLSPADRWDAGWFLSIAERGYDGPDVSATAFFPLYPLLIRIVGTPLGSLRAGGIVVSLVTFFAALYLLHRLTEVELGPDAADGAVLFLAWFPTAFYFSAIYSESLFLTLAVGCLYAARRGWWWRAAVLAALASAARSSGVLLMVPLAVMLLYGPREDREPAASRGRLRPRYRPVAREALVVIAVPVGLLAFMAYVRLATRYGALAPFTSQDAWDREFRGPLAGLWGGLEEGAWAARQVLKGHSLTDPVSGVRSGFLNLGALVLAVAGIVGTFRRLPPAYGVYGLASLLFAASFPLEADALKSLPRFVLVFFPIFMWLGAVTAGWRYRSAALAASAGGLAGLAALFGSGYWIA